MKRKYVKHAYDASRKAFKPNPGGRKISISAVKNALGKLGLASAAGVFERATTYNYGKIEPKIAYVKKIGGRRRKPIGRKLKYIDKKVKVPKAFKKKYENCLKQDKNFGKYTYIGNLQIRQQGVDAHTLYEDDENAIPIIVGGPKDLLDAHSICFNGKTLRPDYRTVTGNDSDDAKYHFSSVDIAFRFKSTSSHVCNIELYEITWKVPGTASLATVISESIASGNFSYSYLDAVVAPTAGSYSLAVEGTQFSDLPDIWKKVSIKVHRFKLLPGDYTNKYFKIKTNYSMNGTMCQTNNVLDTYVKGTKQFCFRVLNDISVSGNTNTAKIHSFPSNSIGGVAMRYIKRYKCLSKDNIAESRIVIGQWSRTTDTTDQQVVYLTNSTAGFAG